MRQLLLIAAASIALAAPASAATIVLTDSFNNDNVSFYTAQATFNLPTGFTNAELAITNLGADDRVVAQLNGTNLIGAGIFGPGQGRFLFTQNGAAEDFFFQANGAQTFTTSAGLVAGLNTVNFIVNNTNNGIFGDTLTGGPSNLRYAITISFDQVPAPAALALFGLGVAAIGAGRRR